MGKQQKKTKIKFKFDPKDNTFFEQNIGNEKGIKSRLKLIFSPKEPEIKQRITE